MEISPTPTRAHPPYTYEDYCRLPDDGQRYELIDGEFYVTPAPTSMHQIVSLRLAYRLMQQLVDPGLAVVFAAPYDVILANTTVVEPDLCVVKTERKGMIARRGLEGPPAIVVEILSPSNRSHDQTLKRSVYARFGIPEYWIVEPDDGWVEVLGLESGSYRLVARLKRADTLTSQVFPQLSIPLAPVFAPI